MYKTPAAKARYFKSFAHAYVEKRKGLRIQPEDMCVGGSRNEEKKKKHTKNKQRRE